MEEAVYALGDEAFGILAQVTLQQQLQLPACITPCCHPQ
jgi:hypothetical protein